MENNDLKFNIEQWINTFYKNFEKGNITYELDEQDIEDLCILLRGLSKKISTYEESKKSEFITRQIHEVFDTNFNGIPCLNSDNEYGFYRDVNDERPSNRIWLKKTDAEILWSTFKIRLETINTLKTFMGLSNNNRLEPEEGILNISEGNSKKLDKLLDTKSDEEGFYHLTGFEVGLIISELNDKDKTITHLKKIFEEQYEINCGLRSEIAKLTRQLDDSHTEMEEKIL